ncbi:hypothetical protein N9D63_06375 [Opitutales bacterium]|nr:hypothetical protein [Opitutales bacterium]
MNNKIAIIFEEEFLGVYPSLINAITLLSEQNFQIEIWSAERDSTFPNPPQFSSNVSFHKTHQNFNYDRNQFYRENNFVNSISVSHKSWKSYLPESIKVFYRKSRNFFRQNLETLPDQLCLFKDKFKFFLVCLRRFTIKKHDVLIAVDEVGMIAAMICVFFKRHETLIVLWSLEIDTGKSPLIFHRVIDLLFSFAVNSSNFVVIQEQTRLDALTLKLGFSFLRQKVCFIPHSPIGRNVAKIKSNFFHQKFGFSSNDFVILHAGWIHDAMCVDQLAKSSAKWKNKYRLVLHEREFRRIDDPFIQYVIKLSHDKVHLSLKPVSFDRIDEIFSSAQIGIIAYDKRYGPGRENAHKASGKLGHFLKCGVPVVALNLPGYAEMFDQYKCGMVFEDFNEIEHCIDSILANYDSFSQEAIRCFNEEFEFKKYFSPLLILIRNSLTGTNI